MQSDDELMERARSGDRSAFDLIVRRHQDRIQRFATRMLGGNSTDGGDIAVEAFLKLWNKRHDFKSCGSIEPWLLKTTHRLALDCLERAQRKEPVPPQNRFEESSAGEAVRDAIMSLPVSQRAVLILHVYEDLSYQAIADALEISIGTVASRKNAAIAILKRRLASWQDS